GLFHYPKEVSSHFSQKAKPKSKKDVNKFDCLCRNILP
ncbi:hypothetical protein X975_05164, partial [Stegodyphus mimosarum]